MAPLPWNWQPRLSGQWSSNEPGKRCEMERGWRGEIGVESRGWPNARGCESGRLMITGAKNRHAKARARWRCQERRGEARLFSSLADESKREVKLQASSLHVKPTAHAIARADFLLVYAGSGCSRLGFSPKRSCSSRMWLVHLIGNLA